MPRDWIHPDEPVDSARFRALESRVSSCESAVAGGHSMFAPIARQAEIVELRQDLARLKALVADLEDARRLPAELERRVRQAADEALLVSGPILRGVSEVLSD